MTPYIFCEPFAGMAALTYWLMRAKPPISYMGSKAGYAHIIADVLGLSQRHKPAAVILGDVGPTVAVHAGLFGATGVTARDVAGWLTAIRWSFSEKGPEHGYGGPGCPVRTAPGGWTTEGRDKALSLDRLAGLLPQSPAAAEVAAIIRSWKDEEPRALWERLKAAGWPSLMPVEGGRWLGPQSVEEVAGWLWVGGHENPYGSDLKPQYANPEGTADGSWKAPPRDWLATRVGALPAAPLPLACWQGTATRLVEQLPERLDNVVAYCDPPYENTTGYKFGDCPREEVLRLALDLHQRGATVAISEAVRLDRELGQGWTAVQIDGERRGQKRTFSVQQSEWVTMNRRPAQVPGQQQGLFGGAR